MGSPSLRPVHRPGPIRWLWYAVGGRLPGAYRQWVLYDLSCRTWPLRHLARLLTQLAPAVAVLLVVLPGPLWARALGVVGGCLVGLLYSCAFLYEATERRAAKAGYPPGSLTVAREEHQAGRDLKRAADEFDRAWRRRSR